MTMVDDRIGNGDDVGQEGIEDDHGHGGCRERSRPEESSITARSEGKRWGELFSPCSSRDITSPNGVGRV